MLHTDDAVLGYPQGQETVGRDAIRAVFEEMLRHVERFPSENPLPMLRRGDLALTSTLSGDNTGMRTQVVACQGDGTWVRIIDRPEVRTATSAAAS